MKLKKGAHIYFMGVGGTGMAAVAGLCQSAGYKVTGSDAGVYPPMSDMLAELGIDVATPYSKQNVIDAAPDCIVVANVLSRGNEEIEHMLENDLPHTSFPAILSDVFLNEKRSVVVAGTHGKTTTCSLLSHILYELGEDPSFFIGGIPRNFPRSFRLGEGPVFVLEGDEYDTAFFDKGPKFLHYQPKHLIVNNLEFDHADIYDNVEAIAEQFAKLIDLVPDKKYVVANMDDPGIAKLIRDGNLFEKVTTVATAGKASGCDVHVRDVRVTTDGPAMQRWEAVVESPVFGPVKFHTQLSGHHNIANITQVVALLGTLKQAGALSCDAQDIASAIGSFASVKRRLDHLGSFDGVDLYEDFAHHPTAMRVVIEGFRSAYPDKRLLVAFEPRSAIQRRNIFEAEYGETLSMADRVFIGELFVDKRIPEEERMNIQRLRGRIGDKAQAYGSNEDLATAVAGEVKSGDAVIFMSSGSFSGVQYDLAQKLGSKRGRD